MYGHLHSDICNVPKLIFNGVKMQIKLTKAKRIVKYISKF